MAGPALYSTESAGTERILTRWRFGLFPAHPEKSGIPLSFEVASRDSAARAEVIEQKGRNRRGRMKQEVRLSAVRLIGAAGPVTSCFIATASRLSTRPVSPRLAVIRVHRWE